MPTFTSNDGRSAFLWGSGIIIFVFGFETLYRWPLFNWSLNAMKLAQSQVSQEDIRVYDLFSDLSFKPLQYLLSLWAFGFSKLSDGFYITFIFALTYFFSFSCPMCTNSRSPTPSTATSTLRTTASISLETPASTQSR